MGVVGGGVKGKGGWVGLGLRPTVPFLNFDKTKILFPFFFMRIETKVSLSHT